MGMNGIWYTELGAKLEIMPIAGDELVGFYDTAAAATGCAKGRYPLVGRTDIDDGGSTFAFAVTWRTAASSCNASTGWAGQYVPATATNSESLTAFWLLVTRGTMGVVLGQDNCTRTEPTAAQIAAAAMRMRPAYP